MRVCKLVSFSIVILLMTVLFAGVATVPAAAQYDTMQFRYNAQHTGDYSPVAGPVPSNGQLKWNFTTEFQVRSSPAVVNGVVYVGSADYNLYAIDASSGHQLWSAMTGHYVESSPAVVNGIVYAASDKVYAFYANNGTQKWHYGATAGGMTSSPAVANGVVYVGTGDILYALDAATGAKLWSYTTGDGSRSSAISSSPAYANGVVYVGRWDGKVDAIYANNGTNKWSFTTGSWVFSSPAVVDGVVYVGSFDHNVYALNAATGAKLWSYTTVFEVGSSPAVANGVVYVGNAFELYAINAATGQSNWVYRDWVNGVAGGEPTIANGVVYIGGTSSNIYAINASTGIKIWNYAVGGYVDAAPAVVNGVVYVGSRDNNVYAIGNQTEPSQPTHITLTTSNPSPHAGQQFTLSGALTTDSGAVTQSNPPKAAASTGVAGQPIYIQELQAGTWVNIQGPITTDQNGAFSFAMSLTTPGSHSLRGHYDGTAQYAACDSPGALTITVGGKVTPTPTPTTTIKPSPVKPTFRREVPCPAVTCAEVCDAHTLPGTCEAPTATPSPTSSFTLPPNITLPPIPGVPEFPLAGFGAGVVLCALAGAYLMLRRD